MLDTETYLSALERDGLEIAARARGALTTAVPACDPWKMSDLVWHMLEVHWSWRFIAETKATTPDGYTPPAFPPAESLVDEYVAGLHALVDCLRASDPTTPCWTWTGMRDIGWIIRRMAHETAVHAWDAQSASLSTTPLDPMLSSDGIDEFLHVMLPYAREGQPVLGGSVHLHCTDIEGEWLVTPTKDYSLEVTREHAKGSCAIRGDAGSLLLLLWRRLALPAVEVIGDSGVADRFVERTSLE
jgi:uncharacterized protein (TIGR03083 family)